jgi:uncharacterized OB-fold protein
MPDCAPEEARIGMPVEATFRPVGDQYGLVDFRPV